MYNLKRPSGWFWGLDDQMETPLGIVLGIAIGSLKPHFLGKVT
jgi:hypothetical protein